MSVRQPCETASCDSTTGISNGDSYFRTQPVPVETSATAFGSHCPIEHSEMRAIAGRNSFSSGNLTVDSSTVSPKAIVDDTASMQRSEKGPDSTFPGNSSSQPPPYYDGSFLSSNAAVNYNAAVPVQHNSTPQQSAIESLGAVTHLPLTILGHRTLFELGLRLDPEMLPAQNWKMMAEYMGFDNWQIACFERDKSPTMAAIKAWSCGPHTVGQLLDIINKDMVRPDVITDIPQFILNDAKRHSNSRRSQNTEAMLTTFSLDNAAATMSNPMSPNVSAMSPPVQPFSTQSMYTSYMASSWSPSFQTHTTIEEKPNAPNSSRPVQVMDIQPSEAERTYDAFVLCNVADKEFVVDKFLPKVEEEANLKLCFAERDIPPGRFAFTDAMNYMFRRSRKLVVILSDEFFTSQEHEWQSNLAISQDPASRRQMIIPVKYKKLTNRNIFDYLGCCDLTKTMKDEWFWDKIINGIKT